MLGFRGKNSKTNTCAEKKISKQYYLNISINMNGIQDGF